MDDKTERQTSRKRDKPLTFDRDKAAESAMKLFWDRGYEGTSFDELTTAMGISPSSFYNSFGSKEELYLLCIEHYINGAGSYFGNYFGAKRIPTRPSSSCFRGSPRKSRMRTFPLAA